MKNKKVKIFETGSPKPYEPEKICLILPSPQKKISWQHLSQFLQYL